MTTDNGTGSGTASADGPAAPADPTATPHQTLLAMTALAGRGFTVIRNNFVQSRRSGKWLGSSLGRLVHARRHRALLAYLLLLMVAQPLDRRAKPLEAKVWTRALSPNPPGIAWPEAAMTPVWAMLEGPPHKLVTKEREARLVKIAPRKENGKGPYSRPRPDEHASDLSERYFVLPDTFWLDGWHHKLALPGLAVLLILLAGTTGRDEAWLSPERADEWYGISPRTMFNGLEELRKHQLLHVREEWVPAGLSGIGKTRKNHYSLKGPFSTGERQAVQEIAREAAKKRAAAADKAARRTPRRAAKSTDPVSVPAAPPASAALAEATD